MSDQRDVLVLIVTYMAEEGQEWGKKAFKIKQWEERDLL